MAVNGKKEAESQEMETRNGCGLSISVLSSVLVVSPCEFLTPFTSLSLFETCTGCLLSRKPNTLSQLEFQSATVDHYCIVLFRKGIRPPCPVSILHDV